jgi:ABC-type nitrate/sulfonate/bicarbonate transport system substrate-binding protein
MGKQIVYGMPAEKSAPSVQYGIVRGFFKDEGIDLSTRALFGGPAIAAALSSGDLSFGHLGTPPALVAHSKGARFRAVGSAIKRKLHMYFAVRSDIVDLRSLERGSIGLLSLGSCDEWVGRKMLQVHGLKPDVDVRLVPIGDGYDRVVDLIATREIDGALAIEPNVSEGEARSVVKTWAAAYDEPYLPRFQWNVLAASDELIRTDAPLLRALLRGYRRSSHAVREETDDFISFLAEKFQLSHAVAQRSVRREIEHYEFDGVIDSAGLLRAIELQSSLKALQRSVIPAEFADLSYLPC